MRISIVIPAYNEEKRIENTIITIIRFCKKNFNDHEIIVVDDGSKDSTARIVKKYSKNKVRLLKNPGKKGKGYSVKNSILHSRYPLVLFTDSDLATPIEELKKFLGYIEQGYDIVIASRNMKGSDIVVKQPFFRHAMGKAFPYLVDAIALKGFKDTQCGFKLFKTSLAKKIVKYQRFEGFSFDIELLFIAKKLGCRIKEAPVKWIDKGDSKVSPVKDAASMFIDLIRLRINDLQGKYDITAYAKKISAR